MPHTEPGVSAERPLNHLPATIPEPSAQHVHEENRPRSWSNQEAQTQVELFVERFGDPEDFHLTTANSDDSKTLFSNLPARNVGHGPVDETCCPPAFAPFCDGTIPPIGLSGLFWPNHARVLRQTCIFCRRGPTLPKASKPLDLWLRTLPGHHCWPSQRLEPLNPPHSPLVQSRQLGIALLAESEGHCRGVRGTVCRGTCDGRPPQRTHTVAQMGEPKLLFRLQFGRLGHHER